jgi:dynein heavy chain
MVLDGPVDTFWIESMNTVLDDNKVLTLLNGDRISMPPQMGLIFEVEDLSAASPATVSRCGMVYLDINDLNWEPYAQSWIEGKHDEVLREYLNDLFEKWIPRMMTVKKACKEPVVVPETSLIIAFCKLLDSIAKIESTLNWDNDKKDDIYWSLLEKWFTFALVWTVGATVNEEGRNMIDYHMRDIESMFPHVASVYDYFINTEKNEWGMWEQKLGSIWKPNPNTPFYKMFVPTIDTVRNHYILSIFLKNKIHTLSIGITGTGKTSLINGMLQELDESSFITNTLIFSGQTTSLKVQEIIESKLIRRTKNKMIPDGKKGVIFIDDLNMPKKDFFGSQPALELIRQWMDYNGWFDRTNKELFKYVIDIQFIAAMGPPGGGRAEISKRTLSKFCVVNFTFPTDKQIQRIFQNILSYKFAEFEDIKVLAEPLAQATLLLFKAIQEIFLPTPTKPLYLFNLRDMSKVIQGLYQVNRFYIDNKVSIFRVWVHENLRVYHDRMVSEEDRSNLKKLIGEQLELTLVSNMAECLNEGGAETIFVDFFDEGGSNVYKEVGWGERAALKKFCEDKLKEHNEHSRQSMSIVNNLLHIKL